MKLRNAQNSGNSVIEEREKKKGKAEKKENEGNNFHEIVASTDYYKLRKHIKWNKITLLILNAVFQIELSKLYKKKIHLFQCLSS